MGKLTIRHLGNENNRILNLLGEQFTMNFLIKPKEFYSKNEQSLVAWGPQFEGCQHIEIQLLDLKAQYKAKMALFPGL